jgi:TonB family protein
VNQGSREIIFLQILLSVAIFLIHTDFALGQAPSPRPKKQTVRANINSASVPGPAGKSGAFPRYVSGGVLNKRTTHFPKPVYPESALAARAQGRVSVQVLIGEKGEVITASAVSGDPLLRSSAVAEAREARFSPTRLSGNPVKVSGVPMYNFVPPKKTSNSLNRKKLMVVSGGMMNGKAVNLPKPVYPPAARAVRAEGIVDVQVLIDETGKVTAATAISGHLLLRLPAVKVARQAEFVPVLPSETQPYLISGIITYLFCDSIKWQEAGRVLGGIERGEGHRNQIKLLLCKIPDDFRQERSAIEAVFNGSPGEEERATKAIELIEAKLLNDPANAWRFRLGVALERIKGNINDDTALGLELVKLHDLAGSAPYGITGEITTGISAIASLAGQFTFTEQEREDILLVIK